MRSIAVLLAAGIAAAFPDVSGTRADAYAALVVSLIILGSLVPLLQGLVVTAIQIRHARNRGQNLRQEIAIATNTITNTKAIST
jgi:hypothetical protein